MIVSSVVSLLSDCWIRANKKSSPNVSKIKPKRKSTLKKGDDWLIIFDDVDWLDVENEGLLV